MQAHVSNSMGGTDQIEIWDLTKQARLVDQASPVGSLDCLMELWAPFHSGEMQLSSSGLLSLEAGGGDVHVSEHIMLQENGLEILLLLSTSFLSSSHAQVWDLPTLTESTDAPPLPPHVTLHTPDRVTGSCWITAGYLATHCRMSINIDVWDVLGHLNAVKKAGRYVVTQSLVSLVTHTHIHYLQVTLR